MGGLSLRGAYLQCRSLHCKPSTMALKCNLLEYTTAAPETAINIPPLCATLSTTNLALPVDATKPTDLFREPPTEFKPIISSLYMRVFENGSLIIYNTQRTDAGYYLCQANNGVGPGLSRVIKLTVHGK